MMDAGYEYYAIEQFLAEEDEMWITEYGESWFWHYCDCCGEVRMVSEHEGVRYCPQCLEKDIERWVIPLVRQLLGG